MPTFARLTHGENVLFRLTPRPAAGITSVGKVLYVMDSSTYIFPTLVPSSRSLLLCSTSSILAPIFQLPHYYICLQTHTYTHTHIHTHCIFRLLLVKGAGGLDPFTPCRQPLFLRVDRSTVRSDPDTTKSHQTKHNHHVFISGPFIPSSVWRFPRPGCYVG
jgi:hypothetical protein